jgi:gamma-glutamylcyclotransferase (GGCT)/AIG2-like uncharacterized protein YtfP
MQSLFTYGSLMCEDIMFTVIGRSLPHCPAFLPDYLRFKVKNEQYPGVIQDFGGLVEGVVYHGIEPHCWERLDRFEGDMYGRRQVMIRYPDHGEDTVYCYVVKSGYRQLLTKESWEFETFLRHGKKIFQTRYLGSKGIA